jgi:hypothetical protein
MTTNTTVPRRCSPALNILDGTVIDHNMKRQRHQAFFRFLNTIEARVPRRMAIHPIVDNYATHKHPTMRQWLLQAISPRVSCDDCRSPG